MVSPLTEVQQKLFYENIVSDLLYHQPDNLFDVKLYIKNIYSHIINLNFNSDETLTHVSDGALLHVRLIPQYLLQASGLNPKTIGRILRLKHQELTNLEESFDNGIEHVVHYLFSRYDNVKPSYNNDYNNVLTGLPSPKKEVEIECYENGKCHWNQSGEFYLVGKYLSGKKEGEWIAYYTDKLIKYIANYHNGLLNGEWVSYMGNAHQYDSQWILYDENLDERNQNSIESKGYFVNNVREGLWICLYEEEYNNIYEKYEAIKTLGRYKNGLKNGKWISQNTRDFIYKEENYLDGVLHGEYELNHVTPEFSPIERGNYVNGKKHGLWYGGGCDNGAIEETIIYNEGNELERIYRKYNFDRRLLEEEYYLNGVKHGNWKNYDTFDGKLIMDYNYLYGLLHGPSISYEEGQVTAKGNYFLGEKDGEWMYTDWHIEVEYYLVDQNGDYRTDGDGEFLTNTRCNGVKAEKGNYTKGKKDGTWETRYPSGYNELSYFNNGHMANEKGQMINKCGHIVNEDGDLIDEAGNLLDDDNSLMQNYYNRNPNDLYI